MKYSENAKKHRVMVKCGNPPRYFKMSLSIFVLIEYFFDKKPH